MINSSPADVPVRSSDGVEKRRGTRLLVDVPITVMGMDTLGEPFKESATTISAAPTQGKWKRKFSASRARP